MVTGNLGYIGPCVVSQLRKSHPKASIVGMDLGFFENCFTGKSSSDQFLDRQIYKDIRDVDIKDFEDFDAIIHLAAISNDPMGKKFEKVTDEINAKASIKIAELAKTAKVKNYVFASSCSVYGEESEFPKKENDNLNPLTAYAKSKINTELGIKDLASDSFNVTCLRFATACGFSSRTRLDLVLNDFVAAAIADKNIKILSDGSPWRPLIHISDMARAIDWASTRRSNNGGALLIVNVGSNEWNYKILDLAEAVAEQIPGTSVEVNSDATPDKRSYKVDFSKFFELAPAHQPKVTLKGAIEDLKDGLISMKFSNSDFRNSDYIRLNVLNDHISSQRITDSLSWNK